MIDEDYLKCGVGFCSTLHMIAVSPDSFIMDFKEGTRLDITDGKPKVRQINGLVHNIITKKQLASVEHYRNERVLEDSVRHYAIDKYGNSQCYISESDYNKSIENGKHDSVRREVSREVVYRYLLRDFEYKTKFSFNFDLYEKHSAYFTPHKFYSEQYVDSNSGVVDIYQLFKAYEPNRQKTMDLVKVEYETNDIDELVLFIKVALLDGGLSRAVIIGKMIDNLHIFKI